MELAIEQGFEREPISRSTRASEVSKTAEELSDIVSRFAWSEGWMDRVRLRTEGRWYERLYLGPDYDIWAISWMPGQRQAFTIMASLREPLSS